MTQYVNKLPAVFQTVTERKFFDATFDQVLSKKDSDYLAGFLGRRNPGTYNPITDFYLPEPSKNRTWWQLEPTAFARNPDTSKTNVFFYEDLLDNIEYYGGNTLNQDRLFNSEYYSFGPPIDYDMFINYYDYYWIDQRLPVITITGVMASDIIGESFYITPPEATPANFKISSGMSIILADDPDYQEPHVVENFGGCDGIGLVEYFTDTTAGAQFEFLPWDGSITLSNGRTINNLFWDAITWDTQYQPSTGDYITIERGSLNNNAWSRTNKWFHIDTIKAVIAQTGTSFPQAATRALRPIIQFNANLDLYNSGTTFRSIIDYGFGNVDDVPITLVGEQGRLLSAINTEYGTSLSEGDLVVFFNDETELDVNEFPWDLFDWDDISWDNDILFTTVINEYIFEVFVNPDGTVNFTPVISNWTTPVLDGEIVIVKEDGPGTSAQAGQTWYYENSQWQKAFNDKVSLNQPPLFQLYDHEGIQLDDSAKYPLSSFRGSEIFSYKINPLPGATVDPVLRFPIVYTGLGQSTDIIFQNDLIVDRYVYTENRLPIDGYYYYKEIDDAIFRNAWNLYQPCYCMIGGEDDVLTATDSYCLETSKQRVIDKYTVGYGTQYQFKLSVTPYGYPDDSDIIVIVNGIEVKSADDQTNGYTFTTINNRIYVVLTDYLTSLFLTPQAVAPAVEIQTYSHGLLDPAETGFSAIPQQLEANPNQEEVGEISGSDLIEHFTSIISGQIGFAGNSYGSSNNYRDTKKNQSIGQFILQNTTPLLKTMLVSPQGDLSFIEAVRFSGDEYSKFKNKYLKVAQQLINNAFSPVHYQNNTVVISLWVEEILKTINISKEFSSAFAYSYMIGNGSPFATESHTVPVGALLLTNYVDLTDPRNTLYVYDVTGQERLLVVGEDYEVTSTNLAIEITFTANMTVGDDVFIALYKNPLPAYIPSTPSKVGAYPVYVPRMEWDATFATPTWVIIGHDGSKTIAYGTPSDIDYRDQLLLELEKRIYNLIQLRFRDQYYLPLRIESVKSGFFREARYSREEYLDITVSYLNKWSAKNRANYRANDWDTASITTPIDKLWKLYNYSQATDSGNVPLNLIGNWKGIFQYMYDTYYPDTRPWEMFGFSAEPVWWRTEYGNPLTNIEGQEVWGSAAAGLNNLYDDVRDGIIRQGPSAIYDPVTLEAQPQSIWARADITSYLPVDVAGEIRPVLNVMSPGDSLFPISYSGSPYEPFDGYDDEWKYGDGAPVEQAWMSTSMYAFSVQEFLFLMRPAPYGEYMWNTFGTELSPGYITVPTSTQPVRSNTNWQFVQNEYYDFPADDFFAWMRPKNKDQVVHGENIDGNIQIQFGYQRWISDRILFLGKDVGSTFGQKVRTLDVNLANKFAGFTNKDTTNTYIESISPGSVTNSLIIPSTNFDVLLHKSPVVETFSYSGVVIRALSDGTFMVYGYDLLSSEFTILDRSNAKLIDVSVGGTPAEFQYFTVGATYQEGEIVRYNGTYYLSKAVQTVSKFDANTWQKLKTLPTVGGVSVTYKPVSEVTITKIPYGTVLKNAQAVFDFLTGWGAWLEQQGWQFVEVNQDTNQLSDWLYSSKQFLFWLNSDWAPDASIQLSPLANKATLIVNRGYPNDVETMSNGVYSILDKFGTAIAPIDTVTDRDGRLITVSPNSLSAGGIYYLQVNVSETEHVLIFDNKTNFNDTVYSPLLRARQQRLRFNGFRSNGWYGKMEAPGYLIIENQLVPNFDTIVTAMRYYYDPHVTIDNPSLEDLGRHLIGYESKSYLDNLQVSNDVQYLFYQGAIRQKGTIQALDKLFRSTKIQSEENLEIYEEWALKLGDFGNTVEQVSTEFTLIPEQNTGEIVVSRMNYKPSHIGFVKQINLLNAQIVYTSVPSVIVGAPDASPLDTSLISPLRQAKAYAVLGPNNVIARIDITDPGYGYLTPPSVTIVSPENVDDLDLAYSVWQGQILRDINLDNVIDIDIDETNLWTVRPVDPTYSLEFPLTSRIEYALPNAGYVNFNDVNFSSFDVEQTVVNWGSLGFDPEVNNTIWVAKTFTEDWDVYKLVSIAPDTFNIIEDEESLLWLRTDEDFLITPQFVTNGDANTDFGNVIVLQVTNRQAIATVEISGEQATATTEVNYEATASTTISSNSVSAISVVTEGNGYTSIPAVIIDAPPKSQALGNASIFNGTVSSIQVSNTGVGYASATITIDPPIVDTANAEAMLNNAGGILDISVTSGGLGYFGAAPVVTIEPPASGTQATATATILNGRVLSIAITNPGTGYSSTPRVFIAAPAAVQATATAVISNSTISQINISNAGSGYISIPNVYISTPDGVTATATATVVSTEVTSIAIVNPGSGYVSAPNILIDAPADAGKVTSITITDPGQYTNGVIPNVTVVGDGEGATATAVVNITGNLTSITILNQGSGYTFADIEIEPPTNIGNGGVASVTISDAGSGYETVPTVTLSGPNTTPAVLSATIINGSISTINIVSPGSGYVDPTVIISAPTNFRPTSNYAVGFAFDRTEDGFNYYKLTTLIGTQITSDEIDNFEEFNKLLLLKTMRFWEEPVFGSVPYISTGDKIWVDGTIVAGDAPLNPQWTVFTTDSTEFIPYRKQEKLIDSRLFESATIFDSRSKNMLALLPVYDPFKNILPGPAIQNITYTTMKDPARYNVTPNTTLFSENVVFGEDQVGQLWWDLSSTRYVYYEQPRWLNADGTYGEDPTSNLAYRRDYWANLFPGSTVGIYEWTKSSVPPSEYTGTGTPRDLESYVQLVSINKFTNITETSYYFWVLNPSVKPNLENRTMAANGVSRLLTSPKSQGFTFFAPIQQTEINNSYLFYNVLEILAYRGNNVQMQYRLSERNDQAHTQWAFFREGDTTSIVTDQFWNKLVDSITGYTKRLPVSDEYSNSILVYDDIPTGWDMFAWDSVADPLWDVEVSDDGTYYGEILPVPDPVLSESEKYGILYRPRQGMFVKLQSARKVFVQAANELLKYIPVRDDNPGWNTDVTTDIYWDYTNWYKAGYEDVTPNIVFQTLLQATLALAGGQLQVDDIVRVTDGTIDGRFVLYAVVQFNPNVPTLSLEEVGIENSAIKLLDTVYTTVNRYDLALELRELLNAFRTQVMIDEDLVDQNFLFFAMVNYVLSEQKTPDWVFKSSYIFIKENNVALTQEQLYIPDQINNIVQYINDVKPYHTQIRDYTSKYLLFDIATGTATDFYKMKFILTFGPQILQYQPWWNNALTPNLGWDFVQGDASLPWDGSNEYVPDEVLHNEFWDNPYYIDNSNSNSVPVNVLNQFVSGNPVDPDFNPGPGNPWPDTITVDITTFDPSKVGFSGLFPYTFSYSDLTINDPQTFVAPENIVAIKVDDEFLFYGHDYYVEYSEIDNTYTVFFFEDPSGYTLIQGLLWFNGGSIQNTEFNTFRNELALGFPEDDLVMNIDTKLVVNDLQGVPVGDPPVVYTYSPFVGWGSIWEGTDDPVLSQILIDEGGTPEIPWDAPLVPVVIDYTISSKQNNSQLKGVAYVRNSDALAGELVEDLLAPTLETDNIQHVIVTAATDIFPDPEDIAGVVWIDGERIEYRSKVVINPTTWMLGLLRRGTEETAPNLHTALVPTVADPLIFVPNKVWVERSNSMPSGSHNSVWQASNTLPDLTTEEDPNEYTSVTSVPLGGLWYAQTAAATFLKNGPGKSIL